MTSAVIVGVLLSTLSIQATEMKRSCDDDRTECKGWAARGECFKNPGFMLISCRKSCGTCDRGQTQCDCNIDGVCRRFGERWQKDCLTYNCVRNGNGWRSEFVGAACKDAYGHCRYHNERMTMVLGGRRYDNCICSINGNMWSYRC